MSRVTSDGKMSPVDQPNKQPVTQRNFFFVFFSLFKGRGTQSQFLETFYDFMNNFKQLTIFMIFFISQMTYLQCKKLMNM